MVALVIDGSSSKKKNYLRAKGAYGFKYFK